MIRWAVLGVAFAAGIAPAFAEGESRSHECAFRKGSNAEHVIEDCTSVIAHATDPRVKADAYYWRAYAYNESRKADLALADLDASIALMPDFAASRAERAFALGERREYAKAIVDLDVAIRIDPKDPRFYIERAWNRHWLADFRGAVEDRLAHVRLDPTSPLAWLLLVEEAPWTGDFAKAREALERATALQGSDTHEAIARARRRLEIVTARSNAASAKEGCAASKAMGRNGVDVAPGVFGDCLRAFLDAPNNEEKADMLTWRAPMWRVVYRDKGAVLEDLRLAAALAPARAAVRFNLGSTLVARGFAREGLRELDAAIAQKLDHLWAAYGMRAQAKIALDDFEGARSDAQKSLDLRRNEVALVVMGDILYREPARRAEGIEMWLEAYKMGRRGDDMRARLNAAGVTPPD
jgi:tetratricopeptide (TPR) repeat protein